MSISVGLYCSNTNQTGYTSTTGSSGNTYYYKYDGGSDGSGNVTETVGTPQDIVVTMKTAGYDINAVTISGDDDDQLSSTVDSTTQATITDADTVAETGASYCIQAKAGSGETFNCDPRVTNQD